MADHMSSELLIGCVGMRSTFRNFELFDVAGTSLSMADLQNMTAPPTAPVPLPAALPMLLAGIATLAGLRRQRVRAGYARQA